MKKPATKSTPKSSSKPVVVRAYSGVFFGYLTARRGSEVDLERVRHIHRWVSTGLPRKAITIEDIAELGVGEGSTLSGVARAVTLLDVRAIAEASPEAVKVIEGRP